MSIEVGSLVTGKVTGIKNFGAFVDLGDDKSGLIHISQIANHYVKDINDLLTLGQELTVKVVNIDDSGKIGLSLKDVPQSEQVADQAPAQEAAEQEHKPRQQRKSAPASDSFDDLMSSFLKDSEERLSSIRRNTDSKRGGRGGRRK